MELPLYYKGMTEMTYFAFIFVDGVRKWSSLILLHVAVQFSQHHLLKRLSFPPLDILAFYVIDSLTP